MRIRFLSDQVYETGGPGQGPRFAKGYILDEAGITAALGLTQDPTPAWAEAFLNRWLQRGVAVDDEAVPLDPTEPELELPPQVQKPNLSEMTRAELDALAAKRGVNITEAKNKADVIAAIELAEEMAGHDD